MVAPLRPNVCSLGLGLWGFFEPGGADGRLQDVEEVLTVLGWLFNLPSICCTGSGLAAPTQGKLSYHVRDISRIIWLLDDGNLI